MTAFTVDMLPTGARACTTFEEIQAWSTAVLAIANPKDRFKRFADQSSEPSASFGDFPDSEGIYRNQSVAIVKVDMTKVGSSLPDWKKLQEISTTPAASYMIG